MTSWARDMAQLKKYMPCKHGNLDLFPRMHGFNRPGVTVHPYNPSREMETG